jgi:hypothetical protein
LIAQIQLKKLVLEGRLRIEMNVIDQLLTVLWRKKLLETNQKVQLFGGA